MRRTPHAIAGFEYGGRLCDKERRWARLTETKWNLGHGRERQG